MVMNYPWLISLNVIESCAPWLWTKKTDPISSVHASSHSWTTVLLNQAASIAAFGNQRDCLPHSRSPPWIVVHLANTGCPKRYDINQQLVKLPMISGNETINIQKSVAATESASANAKSPRVKENLSTANRGIVRCQVASGNGHPPSDTQKDHSDKDTDLGCLTFKVRAISEAPTRSDLQKLFAIRG